MKENYLLVLFYSASGSVKKIAHAIADGAEDAGIKVKIRTKMKKQRLLFLPQVKFIAQKMI